MKNGNPTTDRITPESRRCPECGTDWPDALTCEDYFHEFLFWENEIPALGEVHHLMVLCYHLQHPSYYSREGLAGALELLDLIVHREQRPQQIRQNFRKRVDSGNRNEPITARPDNQGYYPFQVFWDISAADIHTAGKTGYREKVVAWAESIH